MTLLSSLLRAFSCACLAALVGCASYVPPGAKADLQAFAPASIQEGFAAKPTSPFPASIAFVRVQGPTYSNYRLQQSGGIYGSGRYSVVMTREVEDAAQLERIGKLAQVAGVTGVNRMLLPAKLDGDREIREAAARLQADLVFLYTFDTVFFESDLSKPLTAITLGFSPTTQVFVTTTVSGLLLDTRTGYVYATYETTKKDRTLATAWGSREAADETRLKNERTAFGQMVEEFATTWPRLLEKHAKKS
jgi:hypothetical protein